MSARLKVVHVSPHLGGGVGKALATLVRAQGPRPIEHSFVLLEAPEKTQFADELRAAGCAVHIAPAAPAGIVGDLLDGADIVQLEWWNHPATFGFLCRSDLPPMRLLVWSHVSGLSPPLIPPALISRANRFVFSSSCSLESPVVRRLGARARRRTGVVHSGVAIETPERRDRDGLPLRVGYLGSLNFSKLHPRFVDFLAAVELPDFSVRVWGDLQNQASLQDACRKHGKEDLIVFEGYTTAAADTLASLDVFAYLLNPAHYGTGENALVEAMSAGIVPVVLGNPAERAIVEHARTGLVVDAPDGFAAAIRWLADHPAERRAMACRAQAVATTKFSATAMGDAMAREYEATLAGRKTSFDFRSMLGAEPADWFLACQQAPHDFEERLSAMRSDPFARHGLYEASKGSLRHFASHFPEDARLNAWTRRSERQEAL